MERVTERLLACEWRRCDVVNYAMQQNFVPVVQQVTLRHEADRDLRQVTVRIEAEPAFAAAWSKTLDVVPAGRTVDLGPVPLQVSGTFLAGLTERLSGTLTLTVEQEGDVLFAEPAAVTLLAYDEWAGLASMPEMAAAFVMPNHPAVAKTIGEAAAYLERWTGDPSFDAYQSRNPNRVKHQAAALFAALQARQPTYCVAPASFEQVGQRVRLPDAIASQGMGNCFDLTVLYAACLEAVGLHPLIVFTRGHAFPGVWLIEETFPECVQDDPTLLTKRLAAGVHEISVAEATWLCAGHRESYQEAERAAIAKLGDPAAFFGFVDVKRARASSIRPIPIRIATPEGWTIIQEERQSGEAGREAAAPEAMAIRERPVEVDSIAVTKQKIWERKLLDLTLRNSLLNFRLTRSALPLLNARLGELEDALADGREFHLLAKPDDWDVTARSADLFREVSRDHPLTLLLQQEFEHKRLRADANERELALKAIHLYRSARLSLEENGANTLFLALGLLKWYESAASQQERYAPIVLVPVELVRKSSSAGFVLRLRDEEPQINITLLEMLRQDFGSQIGGLDPLPRDEKGIDLAGIFATMRHVIMNYPRWDVVETAILGLFSFSRFVMWHDIRSRADDLAKNKVVASLMTGKLAWEPGETFPETGRLDEDYSPERLPLPISADSSQMTAVGAALRESSFVLHGPPGTGKSQTITNLIASALAEGKTVLFVAEKMAALSVVQSRLEQIGLGPFCLELHSNKSTKKAVLDQLRRTLETGRLASPEAWRRQADRLAASRAELNGHVASLHRRYGFGASLYEAIVAYGRWKEAPAVVRFEPGVVGAMTPEQAAAWSDRAKELRIAGEAAGHPAGHVWSDAACADYTPAFRGQVESALDGYAAKLAELRDAYAELNAWLGHPAADPAREELLRLGDVATALRELPAAVPAALLNAADWEAANAAVADAARHGRQRDELRSRLGARFADGILSLDAASALAEWQAAERSWFLPRYLKTGRVYKQLRALAAPGAPLRKPDTPEALGLLLRYQEEAAAVKRAEPQTSAWLGGLWRGGDADWGAVDAATGWTDRLERALLRLYPDAAAARQAAGRLAGRLAGGSDAFLARHGRSLERFAAAVSGFAELERRAGELLQADFEAMDRRARERPWLEERERQARLWLAALDTLRDWCSWRQARGRALEAGLSSLVAAYEGGALRHDEVVPAYERAWWKAAIDFVLAEDKRLASFSGRLFEEKIRAFQQVAEQFELLTRQEIAARLSANLPPLGAQAASSSEAGILLRAIRSGGRGVSLRKLFEQIPNLLARICPCVLMSPMSVAQYLDPKFAPFDLVVFDEASQLPTSEAVGAMARGRNVIVVGDPKQLPPTSFFANASAGGDGDGDDGAAPEDLESILDDCLALGMPQEHLLWHYRSRHESLIAFSNRHFYENKLLTFPSPHERKSNVRWHPVEGYYDRGKSKHNRAEAERVVAAIAQRLRDPELAKLSIGVVTFNSIQQTLIEDLLDEAYRKDAELERLASELYEPIFVKNLENVQGDERDVILFSIGYGPDAAGKVVLNFGPLNREGGWRRLNVAVSRARREMHVFSTLRAEHLDLSRTRTSGVNVLRAFLDYAERGYEALGVQADQLARQGAGVEAQIAEALARSGYRVDVNVGASGYRVDLAVMDPERPDTYLLAVLCDGDGYRSGKTARDRELLREQVLRQLGWHIHRVWSLDWLDNPARELERAAEAIRLAREAAAAQRDKEAAAAADAAKTDAAPKPAEAPAIQSAAAPVSAAPAPAPAEALSWRAPYAPAALAPVARAPEEFHNTVHNRQIREQIARAVREEGPIARTALVRKVLQAWGISRSGARIERRFDELLQTMGLRKTVWEDAEFYWPNGIAPEAYERYRIAASDSDRRSAEELPPEEIANAVREVLYSQISLPVDDLIRETVKLLGYARTGAALDRAVRGGIREAERRGIAELSEGRALYKG